MLPVSQCRKGGRPNQDDPCSAASAKLQTRAGPLLEELQRWLEASLRRVAGAIRACGRDPLRPLALGPALPLS